jgi:hypothetical protein
MKNAQKVFVVFLCIALILTGIGTYIYLNKTQSSRSNIDPAKLINVSTTTQINQNTQTQTTPPLTTNSLVNFPYPGRNTMIIPDTIISIDPKTKSFQFEQGQHSKKGVSVTVVPETEMRSLIKNDGKSLDFSDLSVGDEVFVRGIPQKDEYDILAKQVLLTSAWHSTTLIIDDIDITNNTLHGSSFIGDNNIRSVRLIPETEIRKGAAELEQLRPVVTLNDLKVGDIAGYILELGIGNHENNDPQGNFVAIDIDVVSPYPCEQYIQPTGCVKR